MTSRSTFRFAAPILIFGFSVTIIPADDGIDELARAREVFEKEIAFSTRPIRDRYLSRLEAMKRTIGSRGDARGAIAVQEEIDRVKDIGAGMDRFAGVWSITYTNGTARTYSITPEGILSVTEENGARIPPRKAKITLKGSDFIVESTQGTIERLSFSKERLIVEHFNPMTTYPSGAPAVRAVGVRVAGANP